MRDVAHELSTRCLYLTQLGKVMQGDQHSPFMLLFQRGDDGADCTPSGGQDDFGVLAFAGRSARREQPAQFVIGVDDG